MGAIAQVGDALRAGVANQTDGKTTVIEIMATKVSATHWRCSVPWGRELSRELSRSVSRNVVSRNVSRKLSRKSSRNVSRKLSRNVSRKLSHNNVS